MMKKILICLTLLSGVTYAQVPLKGSTVDATQGYTVNGTAPNNQPLCGNGTAFVPAANCGTVSVPFYQLITLQSVPLPQRNNTDYSGNFLVSDEAGAATLINLAPTISSNTTGNAATATQATNATNAAHATDADTATLATSATKADNSNAVGGVTLAGLCQSNGTGCPPAGTTTTMAFPANTFDTIYTNGVSRREVAVTGNCTCNVGHFSQITAFVNGTQVVANGTTNGGGLTSVTFVVPPGATYQVTFHETSSSGGTLTLATWVEWVN